MLRKLSLRQQSLSEAQSSRVRIGEFELDLRAGELRREGKTVRLQEQPFQILRMLLKREGEVVTREEMCQDLWADGTIVEFDHSINSAVRKLRRALGDGAKPSRYIETVARRGYRLLTPAQWMQLDDSGSDSSDLGTPDPRPSWRAPKSRSLGEGEGEGRPQVPRPKLPLENPDECGIHRPRARLREPYVVIVQTPELRRRLLRLENLVYRRMRRSRGMRGSVRPLASSSARPANLGYRRNG